MCIVVFAVMFTRLDVFMLAPAVPVLFPRVGVPCCVMDVLLFETGFLFANLPFLIIHIFFWAGPESLIRNMDALRQNDDCSYCYHSNCLTRCGPVASYEVLGI
jgi:hypothetical protein